MSKVDEYYRRVMKTKSKKVMHKFLIKIWREIVFAREGRLCVICGRPAIDVHHIIHRSQSNNLAYDPENGVPLCKGCHRKKIHLGDFEANKRLLEYVGEERFQQLQAKRHIIFKKNKSNMRAKAEELLEVAHELGL